jgi:hypothetical protein
MRYPFLNPAPLLRPQSIANPFCRTFSDLVSIMQKRPPAMGTSPACPYRVCPPALPLLLEMKELDALPAVVEAGLLAAIVPDVPAAVAAIVP